MPLVWRQSAHIILVWKNMQPGIIRVTYSGFHMLVTRNLLTVFWRILFQSPNFQNNHYFSISIYIFINIFKLWAVQNTQKNTFIQIYSQILTILLTQVLYFQPLSILYMQLTSYFFSSSFQICWWKYVRRCKYISNFRFIQC